MSTLEQRWASDSDPFMIIPPEALEVDLRNAGYSEEKIKALLKSKGIRYEGNKKDSNF